MRTNTSMTANEGLLSSSLFSEAQAAVRTFVTGDAIDAAATAAFGFGVSSAAVASTVFGFDSAGWPSLVLVDEEVLGGARGAYDRASDTIYLSHEFVAHSGHSGIVAVIVEEIGHAIDARMNASDAAGDEGEIFAQFVLGHAPGGRELAALQAENDHGSITIDGNSVAVEFASTSVNGAKVGIVYSQTTANSNYWTLTSYSQLFMNAQSQAAMAGVPYDILTEADLTNLSKLQEYDVLVFPAFSHVANLTQANAIASTLEAAQDSGVGLITSGDFMTNNAGTGGSLGESRMATLLGLQPQAYGDGDDVIALRASSGHPMMSDYSAGELIHSYANGFFAAYRGVSGVTPDVLAQQTINGGTTYNAVLATATGGNNARNVHFSTAEVMADNNLLWQAVDYAVNGGSGVTAGLQLSRNASVVAARVDMDQAMYPQTDVSPAGRDGIYDLLIPILEGWKSAYNFVGSYYVDIGDGSSPNLQTNWTISGEYYRQILALGNELGSHSLTHPTNTNALSPAEIQTQFETSRDIIEEEMSQILGRPFTVDGAAVPGNSENLATALEILKYYGYLSGGFSGIGAGYPGAFGYLTPEMATSDNVYLAPNVSFDFSLVEFQGKPPAEAAAAWEAEWNKLSAHSDVPVMVWPWHDYGPSEWSYNGTTPSLYTTEMFTDFISRAHAAGAEFVTLADLANRISSFDDSAVSWSVAGNTVTATVTSSDAGRFALDLDDVGLQRIARVADWYAYDSDSVFVDRNGGAYGIRMGNAAVDVTHITNLPMRSELISLSGNGTNLSFSVQGEGRVTIDLVEPNGRAVNVSGASVVSLSGDELVLDLGSVDTHNVNVAVGNGTTGYPSNRDFNEDGFDDLLLSSGLGHLVLWTVNEPGILGSQQLTGNLASSSRLHAADFNGDGTSDLMIYQPNGTLALWEVLDGSVARTTTVQNGMSSLWTLNVANITSDGRADVLLSLDSGALVLWTMNGATIEQSRTLPGIAANSRVHLADIDGDGRAEMIYHEPGEALKAREIDGSSSGQDITIRTGTSRAWELFFSDFTGDGTADTLLYHRPSGSLVLWEMDHGTVTSSRNVSGVMPGSDVLVGNFSGDGNADMVVRTPNGDAFIAQMNGADRVQDLTLAHGMASAWIVV